jgi:hypothetical protein
MFRNPCDNLHVPAFKSKVSTWSLDHFIWYFTFLPLRIDVTKICILCSFQCQQTSSAVIQDPRHVVLRMPSVMLRTHAIVGHIVHLIASAPVQLSDAADRSSQKYPRIFHLIQLSCKSSTILNVSLSEREILPFLPCAQNFNCKASTPTRFRQSLFGPTKLSFRFR